MAGPWEKYGGSPAPSPWEKYGGAPKAQAPLSLSEQIQQAASGIASNELDFLKSAAKELPLVAMRAVNLPRDILSGATSLIADRLPASVQAADILRNEQEQKLRQGLEKPLAPTQEELAGGKLGRIAARAAPSIALTALTGGASIPAQSAMMGPLSAAQTASEGGSPAEMAVSGGLGALAPLAGPALSKAVGAPASALKNLAVKQYERALGATTNAMKAEASRIAPELLQRGVTGSLKGLSGQATENVGNLGKAIQTSYQQASQAGKTISGSQLAGALERLKVPFQTTGQAGQPVVLNPKAIGAIDDMQRILTELGDTSPSTIWKFRKTVDDIVSASNGFTRELPGGTAKALQKQVRGILQEELNRAVPNVEKLNGEFRLWKGLQDVSNATLRRRTSQEGSLIPAILGGAAGGGVAATGSLTGAGTAAAATALLVRMARTPLWRTTSAVTKNAIADILSGGSEALNTEAGRNASMLLALFGIRGGVQPEQSQATPGQ